MSNPWGTNHKEIQKEIRMSISGELEIVNNQLVFYAKIAIFSALKYVTFLCGHYDIFLKIK